MSPEASSRSIAPRRLGRRFAELPGPGLQRVGGFVAVPELLHRLGADAGAALRAAGLAPNALATCESRIPFSALGRLLDEGVRRTGVAEFGLLAGAEWRLLHLGAVGESMRCAETLGEALETMVVHQHLNSSGGAPFLTVAGNAARLGYVIYESGLDDVGQIYDAAIASGVALVRDVVGAAWAPARVHLARSRPVDAAPYRRFFRAPVVFDAERSTLDLPRKSLLRRLPGADAARRRALEPSLDRDEPEDLVTRLRRSLCILLADREASGDVAAATLSMHRRTLNRRLKAHGTTFQAVLDGVRYDIARQLLGTTSRPAGDIALALRYESPSAFARAFRRWSGVAPIEWRSGASTGGAGERSRRRGEA